MGDGGGGDRALTYKELAQEFGLSPEAARKRVHRLRWRIMPWNDGKARVLVPVGAKLRPAAHPPARPAGQPAGDREEVLAEVRRRAETAEARVRQLEEELSGQRERAAQAEGDAKATREALAYERGQVATERAARQAVEAELADWTAGGPLARAWRGFLYRRGRA